MSSKKYLHRLDVSAKWVSIVSCFFTVLFAVITIRLTIKYGENKEMLNQLIQNTSKLDSNTSLLRKQFVLFIKEVKPQLSIKIGNTDQTLLTAYLINNGKTAIIKKIIMNKNNNLKLLTKVDIIGAGEKVELFFKITNHDYPVLDITIFFIGLDDIEDSKRIIIEGYKNIFEPAPTLVVG